MGDDTVRIHSLDIAAQLRAYREMMFATPIHMTKPFINKFSRWAVQTLMMTGMIQSEENRSGELAMGVGARDWDNADKGRRLDHMWATADIAQSAHSSAVLRRVRGWDKPSDHAPVFASFDI